MFEDVLEREPSALGIVRFVIEPAFAPRLFHTFVYTPDAILASAFKKGVGLWDVLPLAPGQVADPGPVERLVPALSRGIPGFQRLLPSPNQTSGCCPDPINTWARVRAWATQAAGCVAPVLDGECYWHVLYDREGVLSALWCNPSERDGFLVQAGLVSAYARLRAATQLTPRSVQLAFGIDGRSERPAEEPEEWEDAEDDGPSVRPGKKRIKPWRRRGR